MLDGDSFGSYSLRGMLHGIKRGLAKKRAFLTHCRGVFTMNFPLRNRVQAFTNLRSKVS